MPLARMELDLDLLSMLEGQSAELDGIIRSDIAESLEDLSKRVFEAAKASQGSDRAKLKKLFHTVNRLAGIFGALPEIVEVLDQRIKTVQ